MKKYIVPALFFFTLQKNAMDLSSMHDDILKHVIAFLDTQSYYQDLNEKDFIIKDRCDPQTIRNIIHFSLVNKKIYLLSQDFIKNYVFSSDENLLNLHIHKTLPFFTSKIEQHTFDMSLTYNPLNTKGFHYQLSFAVRTIQEKNSFASSTFTNKTLVKYLREYIDITTSDKKDFLDHWIKYFEESNYAQFFYKGGCVAFDVIDNTNLFKEEIACNTIFFTTQYPLTYELFLKFMELQLLKPPSQNNIPS